VTGCVDSRFSVRLPCWQANCGVMQNITVTLESLSYHELHDSCRLIFMKPHNCNAPHAVAFTDSEGEKGRGPCAKPSTAAPGREGNHEQELLL
jgi:hypothetical protein